MDTVATLRPERPVDLEPLTPLERAIARRARQAARIVAAAGLPAEYRPAAYARVLELELPLDGDGVQAAA